MLGYLFLESMPDELEDLFDEYVGNLPEAPEEVENDLLFYNRLYDYHKQITEARDHLLREIDATPFKGLVKYAFYNDVEEWTLSVTLDKPLKSNFKRIPISIKKPIGRIYFPYRLQNI